MKTLEEYKGELESCIKVLEAEYTPTVHSDDYKAAVQEVELVSWYLNNKLTSSIRNRTAYMLKKLIEFDEKTQKLSKKVAGRSWAFTEDEQLSKALYKPFSGSLYELNRDQLLYCLCLENQTVLDLSLVTGDMLLSHIDRLHHHSKDGGRIDRRVKWVSSVKQQGELLTKYRDCLTTINHMIECEGVAKELGERYCIDLGKESCEKFLEIVKMFGENDE